MTRAHTSARGRSGVRHPLSQERLRVRCATCRNHWRPRHPMKRWTAGFPLRTGMSRQGTESLPSRLLLQVQASCLHKSNKNDNKRILLIIIVFADWYELGGDREPACSPPAPGLALCLHESKSSFFVHKSKIPLLTTWYYESAGDKEPAFSPPVPGPGFKPAQR